MVTRSEFVDILAEMLGGENDAELAKNPGIVVANWRSAAQKHRQISKLIIRNASSAASRWKIKTAISPIVEFHRLNFDHGKKLDTFAKRISDESVVSGLREDSGNYAFYEAQGRLVYVGKTEKNTLFDEMNRQYKRYLSESWKAEGRKRKMHASRTLRFISPHTASTHT